MSQLNSDVLLLIFDYLNIVDRIRLERVNPIWKDLLEKTWRKSQNLDLQNYLYRPFYGVEIRDRILEAILKRSGPFLNHLTLATNSEAYTVGGFARKFELSKETLVIIQNFCPRLKSLQLCCHIFPSVEVFAGLLHLPISLESLNIDYGRLDADNCEEGKEADEILAKFFEKFVNLRLFSIAGRGSCYGYLRITSELVENLSPSIRFLDLSAGQAVKIANLDFVRKFPNLETLFVARSDIKEQDIIFLSQNCPKLKQLDFSYCRQIRDFSPIAKFSKLELLYLDGNREFLTDANLAAICSQCTKLRSLSIESCNGLTNLGLATISNLKRLRYLSLAGISQTSDTVLAEICASCSQIRNLQLKYCRRLTKEWLLYLKWLKKLERLGASGIFGFDEDVLCELLQNTNLRHLEATDCPALKIDRTKYLALNLNIIM